MCSTKTSVKTEVTWNADYQKLFNKAKSIIEAEACIKFYDKTMPLYLETDASGIGLRASPPTDRKWHKLSKRHSTRQQHTQTHWILKQKSIQQGEELQQYRKRSIRYITWPGKIPSLLLCKRGKYNYKPQAVSGSIQESGGNIIRLQ